MTTYTIVPLEPALEPAYAAFLQRMPQAMLYYSAAFRDFLADVTKGTPQYSVALDDGGEVRGALPLFFLDGPYGRVYNSLPFYGSHGGPIAENAECAAALLSHYNAIVRRPNVTAATLVGNPLQPDAPVPASDLRDSRIGQFTSIACATADSLMTRIHQKTRNMIRKAEKSGVIVTTDANALDYLRETHEDNLAALGGVAKPPAFFESLARRFRHGSDYEIYVARLHGKAIAALLLFYFGRIVEYYTPVITAEFRSLQPMSLLIYRAMCDAAVKGYELWNWGGTWSSQEGVYRFKKRWDADDRPYTYCVTVNDPALLQRDKQALLAHYPFFYVVPFSALTSDVETAARS